MNVILLISLLSALAFGGTTFEPEHTTPSTLGSTDDALGITDIFEINEGKGDQVRNLMNAMVEKTRSEEGCLDYTWCSSDNLFMIREVYVNAEANAAHLANIGELLGQLEELGKFTSVVVTGTAEDIGKLKPRLDPYGAVYYTREAGFRR